MIGDLVLHTLLRNVCRRIGVIVDRLRKEFRLPDNQPVLYRTMRYLGERPGILVVIDWGCTRDVSIPKLPSSSLFFSHHIIHLHFCLCFLKTCSCIVFVSVLGNTQFQPP